MTTPTDEWDAQFAALKARFPKVRDAIVFAFHALQQNPDIAVDDIKAQAKLHGLRVTAATISAAERLIERNPATAGEAGASTPKGTTARPSRTRRPRTPAAPLDVEALIRTTVNKLQDQRDAEALRLRAAMQRAIDVLTSAVGS